MGGVMNNAELAGLTLVSWLMGALWFRAGREQLETQECSKVWFLSMLAGNLAVALVLYLFYHTSILTIGRVLLLLSLLWVCAWTDWKAYLIPNRILLGGLILRVCYLGMEALIMPENLRYMALSSIVAGTALFVADLLCRLVSSGSIGGGDLKLFAVMGLYLGTETVWDVVLLTLLVSFVCSVFLLVTKRANRKSVLPFAPFLLIGTVLAALLTGM